MPGSSTTMKPSPESYVPSHSDFIVDFLPGDFNSYLKTTRAFVVGEILAPFEGLTKGPRAYTSVQCGPGPDNHVELNSDLVYVNHSCDPTVAFDLSSPDPSQWHVRVLKDMAEGEPITFFYPSTEWDMDQPFDCQCGTSICLGQIQGAVHLSIEVLSKHGFINPWILDLAAKRDRAVVSPEISASKKVPCPSCGHGVSAGGASDACGCRKPVHL